MPIYEYLCQECSHKSENLQKFGEEPLKMCPRCHKDSLKRLFSTGTSLNFKGSGFYITDYK